MFHNYVAFYDIKVQKKTLWQTVKPVMKSPKFTKVKFEKDRKNIEKFEFSQSTKFRISIFEFRTFFERQATNRFVFPEGHIR